MKKAASLPLHQAVIKVVDDLLISHQRYKLMSKKNVASSITKAVFDPKFCNGLAFDEIMKEAK